MHLKVTRLAFNRAQVLEWVSRINCNCYLVFFPHFWTILTIRRCARSVKLWNEIPSNKVQTSSPKKWRKTKVDENPAPKFCFLADANQKFYFQWPYVWNDTHFWCCFQCVYTTTQPCSVGTKLHPVWCKRSVRYVVVNNLFLWPAKYSPTWLIYCTCAVTASNKNKPTNNCRGMTILQLQLPISRFDCEITKRYLKNDFFQPSLNYNLG